MATEERGGLRYRITTENNFKSLLDFKKEVIQSRKETEKLKKSIAGLKGDRELKKLAQATRTLKNEKKNTSIEAQELEKAQKNLLRTIAQQSREIQQLKDETRRLKNEEKTATAQTDELRKAKLALRREQAKQSPEIKKIRDETKRLRDEERKAAQEKKRLAAEAKKSSSITRVLGSSLRSLLATFRNLAIAFAGFQLFRAISEGFENISRTVVGFNSDLEQLNIGIGSLILASGELRDVNGELIEDQKAFAAAQGIASDQLRKLRIEATGTIATFQDLANAFQAGFAPGREAGFNLDQIREVSVLISQAAAALRVPQNQLDEEIRSLITGQGTPRTTRLLRIPGINNEDIRRAREAGELYEFLLDKLSVFGRSSRDLSQTFEGITTNLKDAFAIVAGTGFEGAFESLKEILLDLKDLLIDPETLTPNPQAIEFFTELGDIAEQVFDTIRIAIDNIDFDRLTAAIITLTRFFAGLIQFSVLLGSTLTNLFSSIVTLGGLLGSGPLKKVEEQADDTLATFEAQNKSLKEQLNVVERIEAAQSRINSDRVRSLGGGFNASLSDLRAISQFREQSETKIETIRKKQAEEAAKIVAVDNEIGDNLFKQEALRRGRVSQEKTIGQIRDQIKDIDKEIAAEQQRLFGAREEEFDLAGKSLALELLMGEKVKERAEVTQTVDTRTGKVVENLKEQLTLVQKSAERNSILNKLDEDKIRLLGVIEKLEEQREGLLEKRESLEIRIESLEQRKLRIKQAELEAEKEIQRLRAAERAPAVRALAIQRAAPSGTFGTTGNAAVDAIGPLVSRLEATLFAANADQARVLNTTARQAADVLGVNLESAFTEIESKFEQALLSGSTEGIQKSSAEFNKILRELQQEFESRDQETQGPNGIAPEDVTRANQAFIAANQTNQELSVISENIKLQLDEAIRQTELLTSSGVEGVGTGIEAGARSFVQQQSQVTEAQVLKEVTENFLNDLSAGLSQQATAFFMGADVSLRQLASSLLQTIAQSIFQAIINQLISQFLGLFFQQTTANVQLQIAAASLQAAALALQVSAATPGLATGGFIKGYAEGGPVEGLSRHSIPRPSYIDRRDTIPAYLRPGEMVIQPDAVQSIVKNFGPRALAFLNNAHRLSRTPMGIDSLSSIFAGSAKRNKLPGFAEGGLTSNTLSNISTNTANTTEAVAETGNAGPSISYVVPDAQTLDSIIKANPEALLNYMEENKSNIRGALGV